jgi:autotransporter-associated beta strand protein
MKHLLAAAMLCLALTSTTTAQDGEFSWIGPASSNWLSTANWVGTTGGVVPVPIPNKTPGVFSGGGSGNSVNDIATFTNGVGPAEIGIAFPGTLSVGAINLESGSRIFGNSTGLSSGTLTLNGAGSGFGTPAKTLLSVGGSGTLTLRDVASGAGTQTMNVSFGISDGIIDVQTGGTVAIGSVITGANGFIKSGAGVVRLTGENNFNGQITINGGSVVVGNGGTTGRINGNVQINSGSLQFQNGDFAGFSRTFGGDVQGSGSVLTSGTAGPGAESLLQVTGAWTHTGGTTISGGNNVLSIGNGGALGSISGNVSINNATANLRFNKSNTLEYGGQILGTGGVQQTGSGTTILTTTSSYTGQTTVSNGGLIVNGALGNTNVIVASSTNAALLGGAGTILGDVTIGQNGTLSPGNSIGNLKTGDLAFLNGSTFEFEFDSTAGLSDFVNVNGNLSLSGTVALDITDLGATASKFSLISYDGVWNGGTFAGLNNNSLLTIGSQKWRIQYDDLVGGVNGGLYSNFVTISAVPEPSSLALLSLISACPVIRWKLKKRKIGNTSAV